MTGRKVVITVTEKKEEWGRLKREDKIEEFSFDRTVSDLQQMYLA